MATSDDPSTATGDVPDRVAGTLRGLFEAATERLDGPDRDALLVAAATLSRVRSSGDAGIEGVRDALDALPGPIDPPPVDGKLGEPIDAAARELSRADGLGALGTVGALYESGRSAEERRSTGQFYTPPWIADALARWALSRGSAPRVLDPAAGTGTLLAAARRRSRSIDPSADPLGRLVGVDVDATALALAALGLAGRAGASPAKPRLHHGSFFDLDPDSVGRFDAVVGNPPYVRAGDLSPDVEHFRRHLQAFGPDGETPYVDGDRRLSRRSDAYAYFLTNATRFLRPGGRLAFVLPTKWLASDYGEDLQRFLLDHYDVRAVVGFEGPAFGDALVDTALVFATRRERSGGAVEFVRLDAGADADAVLAALDGDPDPTGATVARRGSARVVARRQSALADDVGKVDRYLDAPAELLDLAAHSGFVPLGDLAETSRGVTTGANDFFFLDSATAGEWGIDDRFLRPAVKSVRGFEGRALDADAIERFLLDVHGYLEGLDLDSPDDPADAVVAALRRDGHDGLAGYVRWGEDAGHHEGRTCQSRRVWFDLGDLSAPDCFLPKLLRERVFAVRNRVGAAPGNAIDCLSAREGIDPDLLGAALNASPARALVEVWGRDEAGMLQLMTYETETLPVPDVRAFDDAGRERVGEAFEALVDGEEGAQVALDRAVVGAVDPPIETSPERIEELRRRALDRRLDGR